MRNDERHNALPLLIAELEKQANASNAIAEQHEAAARNANELAKVERANVSAYLSLKQKLEKELSASNVPDIATGRTIVMRPKQNGTNGIHSQNGDSTRVGITDMIAAILRQHPEGIPKSTIKQKLAEQGRDVDAAKLATLLSINPKFQNEKLSPSLFIWKYKEADKKSDLREQESAESLATSNIRQTTLLD